MDSRRSGSWLTAVAAFAACTAFAGCAAHATLDAAPAETTGTCQDAFDAALLEQGMVAAPIQTYIELTNTGTDACALSGFPSEVSLVANDHPLTNSYNGPVKVDELGRAGEVVVVAPGGSAYIWLEITTAEPGTIVACTNPMTSTDLRLTLPGADTASLAPARVDICTDSEPLFTYGPVDAEQRPA